MCIYVYVYIHFFKLKIEHGEFKKKKAFRESISDFLQRAVTCRALKRYLEYRFPFKAGHWFNVCSLGQFQAGWWGFCKVTEHIWQASNKCYMMGKRKYIPSIHGTGIEKGHLCLKPCLIFQLHWSDDVCIIILPHSNICSNV